MNKSAHPASNLLVYLCEHLVIDFDQRAFGEQQVLSQNETASVRNQTSEEGIGIDADSRNVNTHRADILESFALCGSLNLRS